jgi:hypothetical protein
MRAAAQLEFQLKNQGHRLQAVEKQQRRGERILNDSLIVMVNSLSSSAHSSLLFEVDRRAEFLPHSAARADLQ